jgi:uncharacterized BrkB/YihY/UPF0761 family membrane protein/DNA-binding IscR family transcriptional regulator
MIDPASGGESATYSTSFIDVLRERVPDFPGKEEVIGQIRGFADNARAIAGVGFLFLFWVALSLLNSIEVAFNRIWQVRRSRPLLSKLTAYVSTLIIVPLAISLSAYMTAHLTAFTENLAQSLPVFETVEAPSPDDTGTPGTTAASLPAASPEAPGDGAAAGGTDTAAGGGDGTDGAADTAEAEGAPAAPPRKETRAPSVLTQIALVLASLLMTCFAMTALYYLLPYTTVRLKSALLGGFLAGVLLELAKLGFRYYATNLAVNYTRIYGPLLAIPLFLLWLWLLWSLILIGAQLAFTVQNFRDLAARAEIEKRGIAGRLYVAVSLVRLACADFRRGRSGGDLAERVAESLAMPPYIVREVAGTLADRGILRRTAGEEESYLPGRDPAHLTVHDVVHEIESDPLEVPPAAEDGNGESLADLFETAARAKREVLMRLTFAELAERTVAREES